MLALTPHGGQTASPNWEGASAPSRAEGGDRMPTYSELFQFCLVILGVITLVYQITKKK